MKLIYLPTQEILDDIPFRVLHGHRIWHSGPMYQDGVGTTTETVVEIRRYHSVGEVLKDYQLVDRQLSIGDLRRILYGLEDLDMANKIRRLLTEGEVKVQTTVSNALCELEKDSESKSRVIEELNRSNDALESVVKEIGDELYQSQRRVNNALIAIFQNNDKNAVIRLLKAGEALRQVEKILLGEEGLYDKAQE